MTARVRIIREQHFNLGRHVEHDERSKNFPAATATPKSVTYQRHCPPFDQGRLSSCTGNAMAGTLMTNPVWNGTHHLTETDAVHLYSQATSLDAIPGNYPPKDTGSTGLAVAKAAKLNGYISSYTHAFGLNHVIGALSVGPGILGLDWYTSFDAPLTTGECPLTAGATIRSGHEVEMFKLDVEKEQVWCYQSWGATWGGLKNGTFWFSYATLDKLLHAQGDATFPVK